MLEPSLQAIDRIISLLQGRVENKRRFVAEQLDPVFADMEYIHQNYLETFTRLLQDNQDSADPAKDITKMLSVESARLEHLRVKCEQLSDAYLNESGLPEGALEFFYCCKEYFSFPIQELEVGIRKSGFSVIQWITYELSSEIDKDKCRETIGSGLEYVLKHLRINWKSLAESYSKTKANLLT